MTEIFPSYFCPKSDEDKFVNNMQLVPHKSAASGLDGFC